MNPLSVCGINMRTTSSLESMNAVLKRTFPIHPHIFKFIDRLKVHEFSNFLDMLKAVRTEPSDKQLQRRKLKDRKRQAKIEELTAMLKSEENISPGIFLEKMAVDGNSCTEILDKGTRFSLNIRLSIYDIHLFLVLEEESSSVKRKRPNENRKASANKAKKIRLNPSKNHNSKTISS